MIFFLVKFAIYFVSNFVKNFGGHHRWGPGGVHQVVDVVPSSTSTMVANMYWSYLKQFSFDFSFKQK